MIISELGGLNIGSRPAKRQKDGGVETLRAIPWIFAWTQTRLHLPVWLGIGEAIDKAIEAGEAASYATMPRWNPERMLQGMACIFLYSL